jgi:hypothetical protein
MSPREVAPGRSPAVAAGLHHPALSFGDAVRDPRLARRWTVADLAAGAGVSRALVYAVEAGEPCSTDACARLAVALGRRLTLGLVDPRRRVQSAQGLARDLVHSAMGELEARHLRSLGIAVGIDEPYQHFQFAGRADVVAWDVDRRALLHIENRTRFPDFQEMAGAYNAKRAYLGPALATRLGVARWASETHVIAALWSSEVLHAIRLRPESFRALCPDPAAGFRAWWTGEPPPAGASSALVILDPLATGRQRRFIDMDEAMTARPRHRGWAAMAAALSEAA